METVTRSSHPWPDVQSTQRYIVRAALTPSVFRGCRGGATKRAREFIGRLSLGEVGQPDYPAWLDARTHELQEALNTTNWGVSRKALNVFMVFALMNGQLRETFGLGRFADDMEVPLDSIVMRCLRRMAQRPKPKATTIVGLKEALSRQYQEIARNYAESLKIPRGLLDVVVWPGPANA